MKVISFIEDHNVIDKIIAHLKLIFEAERPPPSSKRPAGSHDGCRGKGEYL